MFSPDGVGLSEKEEKIVYQGPPKEIARSNTRLHASDNPTSSKEVLLSLHGINLYSLKQGCN
jgi:hypothetical protein